MSDVFDKCAAWKDYRIARATGLYPYYRALEVSFGSTEVQIEGRRLVMAGSNNYLGLSADPRVKEAAVRATRAFGTTCSGSRLLNGTLSLHEELERRLARFLGREMALVISTGFQTNLAALAVLVGRRDLVFADRQNHASLVDGVRLGFGADRRYRHGDLDHLEALLAEAKPDAGKLIVTDGVFSMEGDLCDLPRLNALARKYGARVMIDDAHGLGVLGEGGRGTAEYFGQEDETDLVMGTFSKSFASLGGVIAGPAEVINYIKHRARALIFSASMTPASVASTLAALDVIETEPERRVRLLDIAEKMHDGLRAMGFDTGVSVTPVVPVLIGDQVTCFRFWKALFEEGVFANPVIPPAVEPGHALIRTSFMATHTDAQLDRVLDTFERVGRRMGLIPQTRPTTYQKAKVARPGAGLHANLPSARWAAASSGMLARRGFSLEQIGRMSGRDVAHALFDAVETLTYRAASLQADDLRRLWAKGASLLTRSSRLERPDKPEPRTLH